MELPQALHAQLYLLGYDRKRHQFRFHRDNRKDTHWLFGFALRAAMLTVGSAGEQERGTPAFR